MLWTKDAMDKLNTQLSVMSYANEILPLCPALRAAIFYQHYISADRVFLIGFSKYQQMYPTHKMLTAHYTANLYCFKDKLCYHRVKAVSLEAAKLTVKQKDHKCKQDSSDPQPICNRGGMSYQQVKEYGWQLKELLYVSSQRSIDNKFVQKLSKYNRQKKIKSFRIN